MNNETNNNSQFTIHNPRLKKGYKQTDVGIIPEDWDVISYNAAFSFLSTATYSRADLSTDKAILYVHYGDIHTKLNDFLDLNSFELPSIDRKKAKKYSYLEEGDLLIADASEDYEGICKSVELKNVGDKKAISGLHTFLLRDTKGVFANGFKGYIRSNRVVKTQLEKLATGLKVYGVSKTNLKLVLVPLPPLAEQQAIAEVLSDADALVASLDKLIVKKRNIKQGTMSLLLTGKQRLTGFSGDWETKTLGEICSYINDGTHHTPKYVENGIPFYSVENITANDFTNTKFITKRAHAIQTKRCKPEKGDILLTRIGTLGKTKLIDWDVDASIYVSLALLKVNSKVDAGYIYAYTKSRQFVKDVENRSLLNAIPQKINMGDINNVPIQVPPTLAEQKAIAQILSDMDAEIEALEIQRDKYKAVKQAMMSELLTGKTRLNC